MRSSASVLAVILSLAAHATSEAAGATKITLTWTETMDRIEPLPMKNIVLQRNTTLVLNSGKTIDTRTQTSYSSTVKWDDKFSAGLGKEWRVVGPNQLQRVDQFPNNVQIRQITVNGNTCTFTITHTLASGAPYYVFPMVSQPGKAGHYSRFAVSNPTCRIE